MREHKKVEKRASDRKMRWHDFGRYYGTQSLHAMTQSSNKK